MPTRLGKYEVLRRIASGGMAEIFLGRFKGIEGIERLVVLKRIMPNLARTRHYVTMFLDEARIAAGLHHSNIVQIHDLGEEEGHPFFAMELLKGHDVRKIARSAEQKGVRLGLEHGLSIVIGVCSALHYAHDATGPDGRPLNIVHRDVSPHNVFVTYDGGVKLMDFGIAKSDTRRVRTRTGALKGKVTYMSPEQCRQEVVDRRSDVFSLGIVLWELTTGRRLFKRETELEVLKAIVEADAPAPSSVKIDYPPDLERIVMKALHRNPTRRYSTAEDLQLALENFAREHKLSISNITLGRLMKDLFGTQVESWTQAQRSGKFDGLLDQLADDMKPSELTDPDSNVELVPADNEERTDVETPEKTPPTHVVLVAAKEETTEVDPVLPPGVAAARRRTDDLDEVTDIKTKPGVMPPRPPSTVTIPPRVKAPILPKVSTRTLPPPTTKIASKPEGTPPPATSALATILATQTQPQTPSVVVDPTEIVEHLRAEAPHHVPWWSRSSTAVIAPLAAAVIVIVAYQALRQPAEPERASVPAEVIPSDPLPPLPPPPTPAPAPAVMPDPPPAPPAATPPPAPEPPAPAPESATAADPEPAREPAKEARDPDRKRRIKDKDTKDTKEKKRRTKKKKPSSKELDQLLPE
jgi:serine/threonine protein kinase